MQLTTARLRDAILSGSDAERECYYWFQDFFHFSGDHMPNSNEIHIEFTTQIALYNKYTKECFFKAAYKQWQAIWDRLFPHVKIRTYKQVI